MEELTKETEKKQEKNELLLWVKLQTCLTGGVLALLLAPDREMALIFVFFGWYPHFSQMPNAPLNAGLNCSTVRWLSS